MTVSPSPTELSETASLDAVTLRSASEMDRCSEWMCVQGSGHSVSGFVVRYRLLLYWVEDERFAFETADNTLDSLLKVL